MTGSSQFSFGLLATIVKHLKTFHQDGTDLALTLDEILDETNPTGIWHEDNTSNNNSTILEFFKLIIYRWFKITVA
jgi:predicted glycosyltransferase